MADTFVIEVRGLERVDRRLEQIPQAVDDEVFGAFRETGLEIQERAQSAAPEGVTGNLRRGIRMRQSRRTMTVRVKPRARHSHLVLRGRRPGKMPPPEKLAAWAAKRGLAGKEFIIARAIAKRGSLPSQPFMALAVAGMDTLLHERVHEAIQRGLAKQPGA